MKHPSADQPISYSGCRFPPEVICYAVWLYYRFPLSLRMVEEMLANSWCHLCQGYFFARPMLFPDLEALARRLSVTM